jgi:hypothetical protein
VLLITTPEQAEEHLYVRVYPVGGLVGGSGKDRRRCDSLVEAITKCLSPESWDAVGGAGSLATIPPGNPKSLVVRQHHHVHEQIGEFLEVLGKVARVKLPVDAQPVRGGPQTAAEVRIAQALSDATQLEFIDTPLEDVVDTLKDMHAIEIQLDQRAMDDVGIGSDAPITADMKGISLRSGLRLILGQLDLTFVIQDEVLLITTPEEVETHLAARIYPLRTPAAGRSGGYGGSSGYGDESAGYEESPSYGGRLIDTIRTVIQPATWHEVGGPGRIAAVSLEKLEVLVVSQTSYVHQEIDGLLGRREFREVARSPSGYAPSYGGGYEEDYGGYGSDEEGYGDYGGGYETEDDARSRRTRRRRGDSR